MTNPTGFVVMHRHPRYRVPDEKGLGTLMLDDTRAGIAASVSAGDTVLPIETREDPVKGLELKVCAPTAPGVFDPEQAVIIPGNHQAVVDADGKLLGRVQQELDELTAWLDGQTWEISLEESQKCGICLVHRWHQVATMTGVHDKSVRSLDHALVEYGRKLAESTERRLTSRAHDWVDSEAWDYASKVPQPAALLEHAGGTLRIRVDPLPDGGSRPRFRGPGVWLRNAPEAMWTDAGARAAHFER